MASATVGTSRPWHTSQSLDPLKRVRGSMTAEERCERYGDRTRAGSGSAGQVVLSDTAMQPVAPQFFKVARRQIGPKLIGGSWGLRGKRSPNSKTAINSGGTGRLGLRGVVGGGHDQPSTRS